MLLVSWIGAWQLKRQGQPKPWLARALLFVAPALWSVNYLVACRKSA